MRHYSARFTAHASTQELPTHNMSCASVTSAAARVAPAVRVSNKRASNVAPMRAARVNVVAAVDLNGKANTLSLDRSECCEALT